MKKEYTVKVYKKEVKQAVAEVLESFQNGVNKTIPIYSGGHRVNCVYHYSVYGGSKKNRFLESYIKYNRHIERDGSGIDYGFKLSNELAEALLVVKEKYHISLGLTCLIGICGSDDYFNFELNKSDYFKEHFENSYSKHKAILMIDRLKKELVINVDKVKQRLKL